MKEQLHAKDIRGAVTSVQTDISNLLVNLTTIQFRCTMLLAGIGFDLKAQEFEQSGSEELLAVLRDDYEALQACINKFNYMLQKPTKRRAGDEEQARGS